MEAASDELILSHLWLPKVIAQSKRLPWLTEDLEQIGCVGLVKAAQAFDSQRGVRFSTYARYRVNGAIKDWLGRLEHIPPPSTTRSPPNTPEEVLRGLQEQTEAERKARRMIVSLSPKERFVVSAYWLRGRKMREIAEVLGLTEARVSQINKRALEALRHMDSNVQGTKLW